ncbi:hypothetical protein SAMN04488066_1116 [Halorubrum aquaticum]|uniref:SipW-cognate class signal peptide n=1 Tax=Halorubrum aquaticum TaxID=387340 RepID=A0A1I3BAH0_9EURY|nr:hypothetical protein [Halorubrum aquaticum]SFH59305.1 hypothetical protein SAMN04488066_1116 [Halorubrum aquaticum]
MTKPDTHLTRRQALAGIGAVGFATAGMAGGRSTGSWDRYTSYTYAQSDVPTQLLVGWRSRYNGQLVGESPTDEVAEVDELAETVRLIDQENVLPMDTGSTSVGLRIDDPGENVPDGVRVWMKIDPEIGSDAASQALAERIDVSVRYDTGFLGVGGCAGAENVDDLPSFGDGIFSGTLAELDADDLTEGIEVDPGILDNGCLTTEESRCLAFNWEFPIGDGGNAGKGGSVDFDVKFYAVDCAWTGNPFAEPVPDHEESEGSEVSE